MAEQLGSAELELGANLAPLDAKLVEAEARVARSVAVMQAMLDRLSADVDIRVSAIDALAARAATAAPAATPGSTGFGSHSNEIWGIRGPQRPGSIENPIVQVIAAGKYYPMGSRAAAVGDDNQQDTQLGEGGSGLATSADIAELTSAMQDLARDQNPIGKLAKAGAVGISEPESSKRVASVLDSDDKATLARMADALDAMRMSTSKSTSSHETILVDKTTGEQVPASRTIIGGSGGGPSRTYVTGAPGSSTVRLDGAQYAGLISAILDSGRGNGAAGLLGTGGGGGNNRSDIFYHSSGGSGGGGGGRHYTPWFIPTLHTGSGPVGGALGAFGLGKGIAGLAGVGTLASFAGLGAEHALLVALGVLGSAGAAVGGAGALGLGAAGTIGVGAGSDLGVLKSTIADTQTLATAITQVSNAQTAAAPAQAQFAKEVKIIGDPTVTKDYAALVEATKKYGINSTQAATAQTNLNAAVKGVNNPQLTDSYSKLNTALSGVSSSTAALNAQMVSLGNTAGVKAEVGLAKAAQALDSFFDMSTSSARVQAVNILMQAVKAGYTFVPLIAEAATRNLTIINAALKPLFAWLRGPEGIQIWNDLENKFASDLPAAMGAFDNGVELLLRVVDIASNYVGGFVGWLDKLFTRLNSESNMTLSAEIGKLVDDFRLWENFAKLLVTDLYLLFHTDVGTGSSIIGLLNQMLEHVKAYEESTQGSAQLTNIFMVHKQEIDELIKLLPGFADAFSHIYMAFAPAVVSAMNDVVLPILDGIGKALAYITKQSELAKLALGLLLISWKTVGLGTTFKFLGGLLGLGATGAAAGAGTSAAVGAGSKAAAGFTATEGLEALGVGGASGAFLGGGSLTAGIAAAAATALPVLLTGGALIAIENTFGSPEAKGVTHVGGKTYINPRVAPFLTPEQRASINTPVPGVITPGNVMGINPSDVKGQAIDIQSVGKFSNYSATQLQHLIDVMKQADGIKVDGIGYVTKATIALGEATLHTKNAWNQNFNETWIAVNKFYTDTGMTLDDLKDDFQTHMLLITHEIGLNTGAGEKLMATNVRKMVQALQIGMASGTISVKDGMAEMKSVLGQGMQDNAITWKTKWTDIMDTQAELLRDGKINTQTFTGDITEMMGSAFQSIKQNTIQSYQGMFASLKSQEHDGLLSHQEYTQQVATLTKTMVTQEKTSMSSWASNVFDSMVATGKVSLSGAQAIAKELNELLKPLGAKLIPVPSLSPVSGLSAPGVGLHGGTNAATGALYQIGQMGEAGRDSVPMNVGGQDIMVAPGEQVAVFNRHQLPIVNAALARMGGLPGLFANVRTPNYMAGGGMVGGGSSLERMLAEANAINSQNYPYVWGGGHNAGFIGPYDCSGAVSAVLHAGGDLSAPMVADQFMTWGLPGPGAVTVYADPVHTFMSIDGRFFGTHGASGASWYNGSAVPGFVQRHPANIGAGGIGSINVPKVAGTGALADIVRAGLMDVGKAASGKLMSAANATMAGGQFSGGDFGTFPAGLGGNISNIVQALSKQHGWAGQAGDWMNVLGAEDGSGSLTARNPSGAYGLAQFINGPSEYAQYGGNANTAQGQLVAMGNYIKQRYGDPTAAWAHEQTFHNYAGGGMAWGDGGMVPGYAGGGLPNIAGSTINWGGGQPNLTATPGYTTDINEINALLNGLGPGDVPYLTGEVSYLQGITSTDGPSPAQLSQMIGWEGQILNDYQMALHLSQVSVAPIKNAIATKKQKIATLKKRVEDNLKRIKQLQTMVKNGKKYVSGHYTGTDTRHYVSGYYVGSGNNKKYIRGHYEGKDTRKYIPGHYVTAAATKTWNAEIAKLNAEDKVLAGSFQYAGDISLSTGGEIGKLNSSLTGLNTDLTTVQSYLPGGSAALEGAFAMDPGFPIGQAEQTLAGLQASPAASTSQSDLVSLLQQQLATSQETNFVLSQQYNVLSNLPPFGGIFHSGGVVPGPPGAARMILAQGGEVVTPMGGGGGDTHVHISGNNKWLEKLIDVRVEQKTRKMSRDAMRGMPGKPGLLVNH